MKTDESTLNLNLVIKFHNLESHSDANDIVVYVVPKIVTRVKNEPHRLHKCVDARKTIEESYVLILLTLKVYVTHWDGTQDVDTEHFYFVISVPERRVHSRGSSKWEDVLIHSEQKFLPMDKSRFEVKWAVLS